MTATTAPTTSRTRSKPGTKPLPDFRTLILERPAFLARADELNVVVHGLPPRDPDAAA